MRPAIARLKAIRGAWIPRSFHTKLCKLSAEQNHVRTLSALRFDPQTAFQNDHRGLREVVLPATRLGAGRGKRSACLTTNLDTANAKQTTLNAVPNCFAGLVSVP